MSYCHKTFDVLFLAFGYFCTGFVSCASRQACGFCALWSEWAMSTLFWRGWAPLQAWTLFLCPQLEVPWEKQATMHLVWWAVVALEERFSGVILWILRTPSPNQRCFREGGCFRLALMGSHGLCTQWWPEFMWTALEDHSALGSLEGHSVHALPGWSVIQT